MLRKVQEKMAFKYKKVQIKADEINLQTVKMIQQHLKLYLNFVLNK
jgi:hypothetical protein